MGTTAKLKILTTSTQECVNYIAWPNISFIDSTVWSNSFQTEWYDTTPRLDHEIDYVMSVAYPGILFGGGWGGVFNKFSWRQRT